MTSHMCNAAKKKTYLYAHMGPQTMVKVIFRQDGESFQWSQMCHTASCALIGNFENKNCST